MRSGGWIALALVAAAAAIGVGVVANDAIDRRRLEVHAEAMTGGDASAGREALARRPCGGCHEIPGIRGAQGKVGPSLSGFAGRAYVDGRLTNSPDNLAAWIVDPHAIDPQNAMPSTGVGPAEARNMAAYLYTLD
jgi:cytochrome c2